MKTEIIDSWEKNAKEWSKIIQNHGIASRKFTNKAILNAIMNTKASKVGDFGCGEGWLTREMNKMGMVAYGFDAIQALLEDAEQNGPGEYHQLTFEDIIAGKPIPHSTFDLVVFNFCIYLKDGLSQLIENTLKVINPKGFILIQTLHPFFLVQNGMKYKGQWISDSWKGLPGNFIEGHSWYARTLEDWVSVLASIKEVDFTIKEITNDEGQPISLVIQIQKL
ncbi:class I SAM-dependent methyltransferase [Flagellimonas sp. S174]|uniref:class I SAM-dependent methyltransferase n=1 Tax=Flagellimonas sp. S174 TaxID=3410790 RepID=UPI003BF541E5